MQQSESLEQKIDKIYIALLGDEFGSKGIVDRLTNVEKEAELSKNFRQKTMAGLSFIVACGAILAWIGDKIFEILKSK
jgi:hypothetical protein